MLGFHHGFLLHPNAPVSQVVHGAHGEGPGFLAISPSLAHGYLSHTFTATIAYIYIRATLLKSDDPTITICLNAVLCYDTCVQSPRMLFIRDIRGLGPPNSPICPSCVTPVALLDMSVAHSSGASVRGAVVPQRLAAPRFPSGRTRLMGARLELPIFFLREDNGLPGLSVTDALGGSIRLQGMTEPARLGGKSSTYISINWLGLPDYRRQIQTRDQTLQKNPITLCRLVKHVGRSVELFFQEFAGSHFFENHEAASAWRIGEGGIRMDDLLLIGIVHVSPGVFQVVLQLAQPRNGMIPL